MEGTPKAWAVEGKLLQGLEARGRIELPHKGFADLSLTTWVPRLGLPGDEHARVTLAVLLD